MPREAEDAIGQTMNGAAIAAVGTGADGVELIVAAHGPDAPAAALLLRCMSAVASVLIKAPDLRVPETVYLKPFDYESAVLHIELPTVATLGEAAAAVMGWTTDLDAMPEQLVPSPVRPNGRILVANFARLPFGARAYISCQYPAPDPMPEIECADCRGTGLQRDGSPCADCLGKGRIAAPAAGE
jgi:hypothetical protein